MSALTLTKVKHLVIVFNYDRVKRIFCPQECLVCHINGDGSFNLPSTYIHHSELLDLEMHTRWAYNLRTQHIHTHNSNSIATKTVQ